MINDLTFKEAPYFSLFYFQCPCCKAVRISSELVLKLQKLAELVENKLNIKRAYICSRKFEWSGDVIDYNHMVGLAADVSVDGVDSEIIAEIAFELGFTGIGVYEKYVHLDVGEKRTIKIG